MKKKIIICIAGSLAHIILILGPIGIYFNSNLYYSKKLNLAIENENISDIEQILRKKPKCINRVPALMPEWFYIFIDAPRPVYSLYEACASDNIELVKLLIDSGAKLDGVEMSVPLSCVYLGKEENWYAISKLLIESGADINYITHYSGGKATILQDIVVSRPGAALPGYKPENEEEVIEAFKYAIEKCDHSKVNWMSVLQESVCYDRIEIVKLLLDERYCNVNDTSFDMTAIMFAARDSTPEMIRLLLSYGADKNAKNSNGKTAYDYAVEFKHYDNASALKD